MAEWMELELLIYKLPVKIIADVLDMGTIG